MWIDWWEQIMWTCWWIKIEFHTAQEPKWCDSNEMRVIRLPLLPSLSFSWIINTLSHVYTQKFAIHNPFISELFSFTLYLDIISMAIITTRFIWIWFSHLCAPKRRALSLQQWIICFTIDEIYQSSILCISVGHSHRHEISHNHNLWGGFSATNRAIINFVSRRKNSHWQIILQFVYFF